jgi:hypothetical protein
MYLSLNRPISAMDISCATQRENHLPLGDKGFLPVAQIQPLLRSSKI